MVRHLCNALLHAARVAGFYPDFGDQLCVTLNLRAWKRLSETIKALFRSGDGEYAQFERNPVFTEKRGPGARSAQNDYRDACCNFRECSDEENTPTGTTQEAITGRKFLSQELGIRSTCYQFEQGTRPARLFGFKPPCGDNTVPHCLAVCSRSFFSRLISTRVPPLRLATGALPIPIT
jgi:hypothetical protein